MPLSDGLREALDQLDLNSADLLLALDRDRPVMGMEQEMTIGEDCVRTSFNPSNDSIVDQIKQKSAELIDLCEDLKFKDPRLVALAQTAYEEAAMWAIKAATS